MALKTTGRLAFLKQSEIRAMTLACARVGGVNLSQGVCDTPVPEVVKRAAADAIEEGYNTYTRYDGLAELRTALAAKLERFNGLEYDPEKNIVVTCGATGAFYGACLALLDPGDEVIVFAPYYGYHVDTLEALGVTPRFVTLTPPSWQFSGEDLEAQASPKTRVIVVNTPANPCGKVFSRDELEVIADFAKRHDIFLVTDEIYEHFVYDRRVHVSPAALPGMAERTITISGLSKTFAITGWRIGFSASDARWASLLGTLNDLIYVCAPAPLQLAVARGLDVCGPVFYESLVADYTFKRDKLCGALARAGIEPHMPEGAYYVLADTSKLPGTTSKERVMHLLEETGVAAVPGSAFYTGGEGDRLARFCFAKTDEALDEACTRLERLK
jgi:aminotransferase